MVMDPCLAQRGCIQDCTGHVQGSPCWHCLAIHLEGTLQVVPIDRMSALQSGTGTSTCAVSVGLPP